MRQKNSLSKSPEIDKRLSDRWWRLNTLYYITDEHGREIRFEPSLREVQTELYRNLWYCNDILKSRQHGITTFFCIFFLDACLFKSNIRAGIIAHNREDAESFFADKVAFAYDRLDKTDLGRAIKALRPAGRDSARELRFSNNSAIRVGTSLRSATLQYLLVCLAGDTMILTKDSIAKQIKDIVPGDKILTGCGSYQKVERLVKNKLSDVGSQLLSIKTFGYYDALKITENHSILAREHASGKPIWKQAKDLTVKDYIAFPIRTISNKLRSGTLPIDGYRSKERVKVDFDFGWLVGLYLAEGHIRRSEIAFGGDRSEDKLRLQKINKLKKHFNSVSVRHHNNSRTSEVIINSAKFANFLLDKFTKNGNKYIPDAVWGWGRNFLDGLVKGYFDGDGCYKNVDYIQVTSIRRQLIDQLKFLLISLRYGYPSIYFRKAGEYYGRNCADVWILKLSGAGNWKFRQYYGLPLPTKKTWSANWRIAHGRNPEGKKFWRRGKAHYWSRIRSIVKTPNEEYVYDIALKNTPHNYVTVNGVVHNSEYGKICAKFPEKAKEIRTGALNTIHAGQFIAIESTAEGREGHFFDLVQKARADKAMGKELSKMDFKHFFFPWWRKPEYTLNPQNVVIPAEMQEYFDELLGKHGIFLSEGQQAWYIKKYETQQDEMKREFPSTEDEAFEAAIIGAYYSSQLAKAREERRIGEMPHNPNAQVHTAWDLGINDETAIWFFQLDGQWVNIIDFMSHSGEGLEYYVRALKDKGYIYGQHFAPHDIAKRDWVSGRNRLDRAATDFGMVFEKIDRAIDVVEDINEVRRLFYRFRFDEAKCNEGVKAIEAYRKEWNDKAGCFKNTPLHNWASNPADALRTLAHAVPRADTPSIDIERLLRGKRRPAGWMAA